ncbi:MAG: hypothetical protein K0S47_1956 [Herbinix sp.]|jgi:hypothetical protein|nr:hypothetical protein [Herbinix sp.]
MPIKPIDVMKTIEVSHIKQIENQRSQQEQAQITSSMQDRIYHEQRKTIKSSQSENKEFRYDAKEKGNSSSSGNKKKKKDIKNAQKQDTNKTVTPGSFDVLI